MNHDDDDIRMLLDEAVSDVEPGDGLDAIRSRTRVTTMNTRRNWFLGAGAAVVATAATITAVAVLGGSPGTTDAGDQVAAGPTNQATTSPTPTPTQDGTAEPAPSLALPVYYVGDTSHGPRLFREFHGHTDSGDPLAAAVRQAVSTSPDDPDYRTPWPAGTSADATYNGDFVTVDLTGAQLHDRPAGMSQAEAQLALEQLIYTAQAALQKGRPAVQFLLDGQHTDQVLGQPTSEPLAQGSPDQVLAQVWIIDPAEGATVKSGFTVNGLAAAFEANVQWELMQGDKVVKQSFTTAEECCTMAPYSFTVQAPPGQYTLVVHDSDPSGGEGLAPWQDTKDITIIP